MSKREILPPTRPPVPKHLVGNKMKSGNIGISFKALENDDDDEMITFTKLEQKSPNKDCLKEKEEKEPFSKRNETSSQNSSTSSEPVKLQQKSSSSEYKDIFSDFKDRISDKISKKLEEFSVEAGTSPTAEPVLAVDVESVDKKQDIKSARIEKEKIYRPSSQSVDKSQSENDISEFHDPLVCDVLDSSENECKDFEVVENFFTTEPHEDFMGTSTVSPVHFKNKSTFQKIIHGKHPREKQSPMTMSSLLTVKKNKDQVVDSKSEMQDECVSECVTGSAALYEADSESVKLRIDNPKKNVVPLQRLVTIAVVLFAYLITPLPSFLSGLLLGVILTTISCGIYMWIVQPPKPSTPIEIIPLNKLPPLLTPEMKVPKKEDYLYEGWMNEIMDYNCEDYHINKTNSIHIRLEKTALRLRRPKVNISKRSMWNEPKVYNTEFVHQRHFDIAGCRVFLMPAGLVKKRVWSKKYPICIALSSKCSKDQHISDISGIGKSGIEQDKGFEIISKEQCETSILYLFARTPREKEEWFKRFEAASLNQPLRNNLNEILEIVKNNSEKSFTPNACPNDAASVQIQEEKAVSRSDIESFVRYMGRLMPSEASVFSSAKSCGSTDLSLVGNISCNSQLLWLNALIGRCFWDFLREKHWADIVTEKLQRKLSKIHVPYFIEDLTVTDIDLGEQTPVIRRAGTPYLDEQGFWVDLDIAYNGGFKMTIETKLNLMKLKKNPNIAKVQNDEKRSASTDSAEEDSAESSTDEEEESSTTDEESLTASGGSTSKKLLKLVDKLTKSKYFQQATEYKYVKKAMEGVSNTPIILTVEVKSLIGNLAINIPPPTTDRMWYGFRDNPKLWLSAKPKVGARAVNVTHVTEWIEKKLAIEFQRVFVMPNMDDLVVPILLSGIPNSTIPTIPKSNSSTEV